MEKIKIREIVSFIRGVSYKKEQAIKESRDGYTIVLRANNINDGEFKYDDLIYVPSELVSDQQLISKGDIVITMSSGSKAHVGKVAIAKNDINVAFGAFCAKIVPKGIVPKYLYYILRGSSFRQHIEIVSKGTNINNLKQEYILDYEIYLPPVEVQEYIVNQIEELFSQLDDGVKTLNKTKAQLKVYRQAVLKEAFRGKLTEDWRKINKKENEWKTVSITELVKKEKNSLKAGPFGSSLKKEFYTPEGYKVYGQEQVIAGDENIGDYYVDEKKYHELNTCKITPNDVLISLVGTVGKVLVLSDSCKPGIINPRLIKVSLDDSKMIPMFFKYYFESGYLRSLYKEKVHGATMDVLNMGMIKELPFYCCPVEEQCQVLNEIESRLSICDNIEKTVDNSLKQVEALRQSILKKAFEGEL